MFRIAHELSESACRISACDPACTSVLWKAVEDKLTLESLGTHVALFLNTLCLLTGVGTIFRYTVLHSSREVRKMRVKQARSFPGERG